MAAIISYESCLNQSQLCLVLGRLPELRIFSLRVQNEEVASDVKADDRNRDLPPESDVYQIQKTQLAAIVRTIANANTTIQIIALDIVGFFPRCYCVHRSSNCIEDRLPRNELALYT